MNCFYHNIFALHEIKMSVKRYTLLVFTCLVGKDLAVTDWMLEEVKRQVTSDITLARVCCIPDIRPVRRDSTVKYVYVVMDWLYCSEFSI